MEETLITYADIRDMVLQKCKDTEEDEYGISSTPFKNLIDHLKYYYEHETFDSACFNAIYKMLDNYDFTSDGEVMSILKQLKNYC